MPSPIDRPTLQRLVAAGVQLIKVLPKDEYDEEHLPGAVHVPLKSLTPRATADLATDRRVIVYCWDTPDNSFDAATEAAVKRWEMSLGLAQDGVIEVGEVVFLPGAQRMGSHKIGVGGDARPGQDAWRPPIPPEW